MNEDLFHLMAVAGYEYNMARAHVADIRKKCKNGVIVQGSLADMKAKEFAYKDATDAYFKKLMLDTK